MNLPKYSILTNAKHETYEFLSIGPRGTIKKIVNYTEIQEGVYNLGFGDWNEIDKEVKDNIRSNNADRDKVLTTVASTVVDFMKFHPEATIVAQGETLAKSRLYQMGINSNWREINELFQIQGFRNGAWESFEKGKNYEIFALKAAQNL